MKGVKMKRRWGQWDQWARLTTLLLLSWSAAGAVFAQQPLPTMDLSVGIHRIEAEVAATPEHRSVGLMHRKAMPPQHGMLFVFPQLGRQCMWMRNTYLPLSVAFIDDKGVILNIEDMQPETETNHCAVRDARYALEMNLGWFRSRGFKAGVAIGGIERAPRGM